MNGPSSPRPGFLRRWTSAWRGRSLLLALLFVVSWPFFRHRFLLPAIPRPDAEAYAHAAHVQILRDTYGVPHVFGETDADAAFGLAYAQAEDEFPTVQDVFAAERGQLSLLHLSKTALANDYYVHLVHVREQVERGYERMPADVRAVLEAYARGLDLYAYNHPREADGRIFPLTGRDVAAGFVHKLPLMVGLPDVLSALRDGGPHRVGDRVLASALTVNESFPGSNAHAVLRSRSTDDVTRLNVNSHQPWEGPVAWYEAQIVSKEGWNITGANFSGAPFLLVGASDHLGWAHTVNSPDLIDVYQLAADPSGPYAYRYDGAVRQLERSDASIAIDVGFFTVTVHKEVLASAQGPVLETDHGRFALGYAGSESGLVAVEQWFRMNKAQTFAQWKDAMRLLGIPMFNTVYADRDHAFYVYNARLPERRAAGFDYESVLPGDRSDVLAGPPMPFEKLPQVLDPPAGFVFSCNSSPFAATSGAGNPPDVYPPELGIEHTLSNRARRSLTLLAPLAGSEPKVSPADFLAMKWDRGWDRESTMYTLVVRPLLDGYTPKNEDERAALQLLRDWDGVADEGSEGATIAILTDKAADTAMRSLGDPHFPDAALAFADTVAWLEAGYGTVHVPLGTVQRLRRGELDLPIGGGPDVLNATYAAREGDHRIVGNQGDSYILLADFAADGMHARSISNYGASARPESPHYADQAALFVAHRTKPAWRAEADIRAHLERAYRPGE